MKYLNKILLRLYSESNVGNGTLSHSRLRNPAFHSNCKGKGVGWERSPNGWPWPQLNKSVDFHNIFFMSIGKGEYKEWGGLRWELSLCLRIDILWSSGSPMPELNLTPLHSRL
jgi:hypothetical protein